MKSAWVVLFCAATANAQPSRPIDVKTDANDDLPHRKSQFATTLQAAERCIPRHKDFRLSIDAFGDKLVVCAQAETREGSSVFFDMVSFACWNVDPASAKLVRRADLGRGFFACQDGCNGEVAYGRGIVAYHGRSMLYWDDDDKHPIEIYSRKADGTRGDKTASFLLPPAASQTLVHQIVYVGPGIIGSDAQGTNIVFDETGKVLAQVPPGWVRVMRETLIAFVAERQATLLDLAVGKTTVVTLDKPYSAGPVVFRDKAYAIIGRSLNVLDATTLQFRKSLPLPFCK